jgi:hypothetical protein
MAAFKAFKPSGMEKIARSMGYTGNMKGFNKYLSKNPSLQKRMQSYTDRAINMARGGLVFNGGGDVASGGYSDFGGYGDSGNGYASAADKAAAQQRQQAEQQAAAQQRQQAEQQAAAQAAQAAADKAAADKAAADTTGTGTTGTGTTGTGTTGTGTTGTGTTGTGTTGTGTTGTGTTGTDTTGAVIDSTFYRVPGQDPVPIQNIQPLPDGSAPTIGDVTAQRMQNPGLPIGAATTAAGIWVTLVKMLQLM